MASKSGRLLSLAAGVVQEFSPEDAVRAAGGAGFDAAGIWLDQETFGRERTRAVRSALIETGIVALDIEVAWLRPGEPDDAFDIFVDIGAEIGARHILVVSNEPEIADTKRRFEYLCRRAEGSGLRVMIEFLGMTEVKTLGQAISIVRDVGHPAGGILIDALHLVRTGSSPADLSSLDPGWFPYVQLCDAPLTPPEGGPGAIAGEALGGRLQLGEGGLPLGGLLEALPPGIPISMEIRSNELSQRFPDDALGRARVVWAATREWLASQDSVVKPR